MTGSVPPGRPRLQALAGGGEGAGSPAGGLRVVTADDLRTLLPGLDAPAGAPPEAPARGPRGGASGRSRPALTARERAERSADRRAARAEQRADADAAALAADPAEAARQLCLRELAHGPRTRAELAALLLRAGVPDDVSTEVLGRYAEVGVVDDALFSQMWVSSRARKGLARGALKAELRRKGVDEEVAAEAVDAIDDSEERAAAHGLIARKLAATRGLDPDVRTRRLVGVLARKGYGPGLSFAVVREALAAEGVDPLHLPETPEH